MKKKQTNNGATTTGIRPEEREKGEGRKGLIIGSGKYRTSNNVFSILIKY